MNPRFAATMELQRPAYRDPASLIGRDVCPHCKRLTTAHGFLAPDGHWIFTHHCAEHGDVAPMRLLSIPPMVGTDAPECPR